MRTYTDSFRGRSSIRLALGTLLTASAVCVLALTSPPAWPQAAGQGSATAGPAAPTAPGAVNPNLRAMAASDLEMMEDLAHANLGEVEAGRMALEKSRNERIRQFAQTMINDHTSAMRELQQLADRKGAPLPRETDFQHKAVAVALRLLSGETFDERYVKHVGVNDHRRTVDLLEKAQRTSADQDLKAYASKTLPVVQRHLAMARQMSGSTDPRTMGAGGQPSGQPSR